MKIPPSTLYFMLCYAWDAVAESALVRVDPGESTSLDELLARVLVAGTERMVHLGLDRGFVPSHAAMQTIRGSIDFTETLRGNALHVGKLHCTFDELEHDVPHNQILKATLLRLSKSQHIREETRRGTFGLLRAMTGISTVALTRDLFGKVQLTGGRRFYRFLVNVCELLFARTSPREGTGTHLFRGFDQDEELLWRLFQRFVRAYLAYHAAVRWRISATSMPWRAESSDPAAMDVLPGLATDITATSSDRIVIVEAKFYESPFATRFGRKQLHAGHLYQLMAYLQNFPSVQGRRLEGVLLYAGFGSSFDFRYEILSMPIRATAVDLAGDATSIGHALLGLLNGNETALEHPSAVSTAVAES